MLCVNKKAFSEKMMIWRWRDDDADGVQKPARKSVNKSSNKCKFVNSIIDDTVAHFRGLRLNEGENRFIGNMHWKSM